MHAVSDLRAGKRKVQNCPPLLQLLVNRRRGHSELQQTQLMPRVLRNSTGTVRKSPSQTLSLQRSFSESASAIQPSPFVVEDPCRGAIRNIIGGFPIHGLQEDVTGGVLVEPRQGRH